MTDAQLAALIAAIAALLGGVAAFVRWMINRSPDAQTVADLVTSVRALNETMIRVETKIDTVMGLERKDPTPVTSPGAPYAFHNRKGAGNGPR